MGTIQTFEEIEAWQKARAFSKKLYEVTREPTFDADIDLKRQLRRAAVSISSNIAEGFERGTKKEFAHFLFIAKASAGEIRSQLYLAKDLEYINENEFERLKSEVMEVSRLLSGFIKYLKR